MKKVLLFIFFICSYHHSFSQECYNAGNDTTICLNSSVILNASGGISYTWSPATGLSSTSISNPTANPTVTTTYTVTVMDLNGCTASDEVVITVEPLADATFIINNDLCIDNSLDFVNGTPNATYLWNFGDGSTSTAQNPQHTYSMPGIYQVSLIVTTANCGTDCSSQYIQIARSCCVYSVDYTSSTDFYENYTTPPGTTTWSSGLKRIEKTLTVAAGCILEINGSTTVEFGPFGKIVVERGNPIGGTLKISGNAILTSVTNSFPSCRVMWQGIEVEGFADIPHPSNVHGKIIITGNGSVRNAHIGVLLGRKKYCFTNECSIPSSQCIALPYPYMQSPYYLDKSGGIINTNGGIFSNNAVNIQFAKYDYNNASFVHNSTFTGGTLFDPGYNLNNVGYTYNNNNTSTSPNPLFANANSLGRSDKGIYMWGIRFAPSLQLNPQVLTYPFDNNSFDNIEKGMVSITSRYNVRNSIFINLSYGIQIFNDNSPVQGHTISTNTFNLIKPNILGQGGYMIQIEGGKYDKMKDNKFRTLTLGNQSDNYVGVLLNNTSNFSITDNDFYRLPIGIQCYNSAGGGGDIKTLTRFTNNTGNIFTQCRLSIETRKDNTKLNIKCNTSNNTFPVDYGGTNWLNPDGVNRLANQGIKSTSDSRKPAGNKFTPVDLVYPYTNDRRQIENKAKICFTLGSQTNCLTLPYTYNAHQPTTVQTYNRVPVKVGYINVNTGSAEYQEGYSCKSCIVPGCGAQIIMDNDVLINQLKIEYSTIKSNLDKGKTIALIGAIDKINPTPDGTLKNMLLNASPLSDTVLSSFIVRQHQTAPGIFKDVVIPNSPVSDTVRAFLEQKLPSLPPGIAKQIEDAQAMQNTFRTLALIQSEIDQLQTERQMALNTIISEKTDSGDFAMAMALLENENTVNAKQTLIATYLSENNISEAVIALNNFVPSTTEKMEWKELMGLLADLAGNGKTVFDITPVQEQFIRDLAYAPEVTLATVNAQAILRLLYGEEFTLDLSQSSTFKMVNDSTSYIQQTSDFNWQLYPNPANDYIEILYQLSEDCSGKLEVFSVLGMKTDEILLQTNKTKEVLRTTSYTSGIYYFKLSVNTKYIGTKKVIIIK